MSNAIAIPRELDDESYFIVFRTSEFGLIYGVLTLCLLARSWIPLVLLMTLPLVRRFRDRHPDGYIIHALYWWTGFPLNGRSFVNPFARVIR